MIELAHLTRPQLEQLRRDPRIGDVTLEKVQAALGQGTQQVAEPIRSTDSRDRMNATEQRMAAILECRVRSGEMLRWWFDDLTFRVGAGRTTYRPDFVAQLADGTLEIIEVKGARIWDDSKVKFKAAAQLYPIARWRMLQWIDGEWRTLHDFSGMRGSG